ncbi:glycosyltransferase family 1 protein [Pseudanabaena sp. FACHB-2040]|uniref:glycosyltransferase n=1 Tax=Pseudanabaena sp. FACHB-2040 TaxID=2692859 RepID=UPI001686F7CE|nr:glycosyltransferase family 1 protein [Pseudanabaena sp. FACHB-2040]MBD2260343.1 glycosyltransferase family 1 protein [Pseudanabaena sp. FACHB-2040]
MGAAYPPLSFYLPKALWPETLPTDANTPWPGFGLGVYAWTIQTYLRLKAAGLPCALVSTMPQAGIVFAHCNVLRGSQVGFKTGFKRLLVCLRAELLPVPYAQLQVVQNPQQANATGHCYWIPHWPQPGLIPRDRQRGHCIENVAFLGHANNLATELTTPAWRRALGDLGLAWQPKVSTHTWHQGVGLPPDWHDYRQIDAVVAVRSFRARDVHRTQNYRNKPATKLYNAWLAGVPAILGEESAYWAERRGELDFLAVSSPSEILAALGRLQQDAGLYRAMVENGLQRAETVRPEAIVQRWLTFIEQVAVPAYERWDCCSSWGKAKVLGQGLGAASWARVEQKVRSQIFR